eukprot:g8794.t1
MSLQGSAGFGFGKSGAATPSEGRRRLISGVSTVTRGLGAYYEFSDIAENVLELYYNPLESNCCDYLPVHASFAPTAELLFSSWPFWIQSSAPSAFLSCRVLKQDYPACVVNNQATHQYAPPCFLVCVPLHCLSFCRSIPACCSLDGPFFFSRDCTLGHLWFPYPVLELDHPSYVASNQATNQHVFPFSCVLLHDLFHRSIPVHASILG